MRLIASVLFGLLIAVQSTAQVIDSLHETIKTASAQDKVDILIELVFQYRNSDRDKADSLLEVANVSARELNYEKGIARVKILRGILFNDQGNYDKAIDQFQSALPFFESSKDSSNQEAAYNNLGISYKRLGNLDSSNISYQQALRFVSDEFGKARLLLNIGSNFISEGKLDSATQNHIEAIKVFERINHQAGLTIAYLNLGNIYYKQDAYDQAMKYYHQSLENAIASGHKPVQSRNYLNIGSILSEKKQYDSALYYFKSATALQEAMGDQTGLAASYRNIGEVTLELGDTDAAEEYFQKSLSLYEKTSHKEGIIRANKFLANLYLDKQEFVKAKNYINRSIDQAREAGMIHELQRSLEFATKIYEASGDYKFAYGLLAEEKTIGDSIFKQEKITQIDELQTQYETAKKDQEIQNLSQQSQIQALQISQRNTLLAVIVIAFLVLVLAGFIFYQRRKYKHQQAVSNIEQRALRLQMNPHFIFNALASIQNYILQSDTKESVKYLSKFGKLMRQILEHSRQEFISIEDEADMLTNYLQIQQLRFQNSFQFTIHIADELDAENVKIPPLFAQPLVENAIEHGLTGVENGLVEISFDKTKEGVLLSVSDNGRGMNKSVSTTNHKSMATKITLDRLGLFGQRFASNLKYSHPQKFESGTLATLILPHKS
ncbi:tetratricopeptide repeat-containing sensor histidine kinase [Marinoscillum pacificum]|uniref:tetratricopeptide repeat-containing sensor histidine kinase n=1 Tax=Marinoscillum pacificum TaxID=392723 RepID=UPI0021580854|nr:tetratricopeptide repeat protein [Marinoscillum pacificum]